VLMLGLVPLFDASAAICTLIREARCSLVIAFTLYKVYNWQ